MRRVVIESPYAGHTERNLAYARVCMLDSLERGEAPIASHLLYTQVLSDDVPEERSQGIEAGLAWHDCAEVVAVYTDLGISGGMRIALDRVSAKAPSKIDLRTVPDTLLRKALPPQYAAIGDGPYLAVCSRFEGPAFPIGACSSIAGVFFISWAHRLEVQRAEAVMKQFRSDVSRSTE